MEVFKCETQRDRWHPTWRPRQRAEWVTAHLRVIDTYVLNEITDADMHTEGAERREKISKRDRKTNHRSKILEAKE